VYIRIWRRRVRYAVASSALRTSGSGAIQVYQRGAGIVQQLPRILFHVNPVDADTIDGTVRRQRLVELRDLIALGQIGIEVILTGEYRARVHGAAGRQRDPHRQFHRFLIEHRQCPRITETDGAHLCIGRRAESGGTGAEDLRAREETGVDFQSDDDFPGHRRHCKG
jgi:hypothetical protein